MSGEMERYEPQAPMGGNPAHVRLGLNDVARVANAFAESGLFKIRPKGQSDRGMTPTECYAVIMAGQSMGLGPMPSMMNFHMIEGRPEMSANLQAYFLKASGKYDYRVGFGYINDVVDSCTVSVVDTKSGEIIGQSVFTMAMAKKAGLSGHNWTKYPESMLFARAISNAVAWHAPDCVPFRIYGEGEISEAMGAPGVVAVEGEAPPSATRVEAIVERALKAEPDEEIAPSEVEITEPEPNVGADPDAEPRCDECDGGPRWHKTEPGVYILDHAEGCSQYSDDPVVEDVRAVSPNDRFSPEAVETRLRADLPNLETGDKEIIRATVEASDLPWNYASIVKLICDAGYTDVFSWLRQQQSALSGVPAAPQPEPEAQAPDGVTGAQTGSQTAARISDRQMRMLNGRMSACHFTEAEMRFFIKHYAGVDSRLDILARDFDDLLTVLNDIQYGDASTRQAYLAGGS